MLFHFPLDLPWCHLPLLANRKKKKESLNYSMDFATHHSIMQFQF